LIESLTYHRSKYLIITKAAYVGEKPKTDTWYVRSSRSDEILGVIKWFGRWHQYAHFPEPGTVWNPECNDVINEFIRAAMADWRERKKSPRA
jgi:hypothetical protein